MILVSIALYALSLFLSAIPLFPGTGGFVYTAEGFCFSMYPRMPY